MHKHIGLWSLLEKAVSQGLKDVSEIQQKKMPEAGSGCLFILFFFFFYFNTVILCHPWRFSPCASAFLLLLSIFLFSSPCPGLPLPYR